MKLLDLYCCQHVGGYGFEQAGFDVTGVDLYNQPKHPGKFIQADAIEYVLEHGHEYDYIHASPPCQEHSTASMQFRILGKKYPDLISATRAVLISTGKPYDIENVPNAPLINPIILCGTMFGLSTYRHRLFEANWDLPQPLHLTHVAKNAKMGRAIKHGEFIQYVGHFSGVQYVRDMTGCQWADQYGLAQSIPPQYTKYIGEQFLKSLPQPPVSL
jgi:DNA (cytosine-5)-methyltransferase 1